MVRGKKQWLKPSDLITKKLTECEKQRNKRIKENCEIMNNLGVKNITNSLVSMVQPKCANARENGIRLKVDDDVEYNPLESEDDNDDESLGSFDCKEQEMAQGLHLQSHSRPLTPTPEEMMDPPSQEVDTQPLPPHNVQPEHEVTASSSVASHDRRGRGPTRGIQAHRIIGKDGKMLFPIPEQFHSLVGDNAFKLVSKIAKALDTQFGRRLSDFTYKLHKQYKLLKDAREEDYARSHPPARVTLNQWISLIDKCNSPKFKEQSLANVNNMMQMKTKHRCGSKSIPVRIIANGKVPDLAEFYKSIHYNSDTHEWISSESQVNYDSMIQTQAEHLSQTSAIPLTPEELLVKVLSPRPGNNLEGSIPPQLSILSKLNQLSLSRNHFSGNSPPSLGNLSALQTLDLLRDNLHGSIPSELGQLSNLQYFQLSLNTLSGMAPAQLCNISSVQVFDVRNNSLGGSFPSNLGLNLPKLQSLLTSVNKFFGNHFSGNIPPSLGNLSALQILDLAHNNLHRTIPIELGHLSNLYAFQLSSNNLSGMVPDQLYSISTIQIFSVTNNSLSGNFPSNLGLTLPKLQLFLADKNQFFGSIPASLANASGLAEISIGDNALIGPIPLNLGSLQYLQVLHIAGNPLGTDKANDISFLTTLINCTNLRVLSLSNIQIGGNLPNSIGNLSSTLTWVWLDENYISGNIPQEITELVGLSYITIDTNMLTGSIPDSVGKLTNLQKFYLFINNISGEILYSIGNITGLVSLILEENMLEGSIPVSLGYCSNLEGLHLARNRLTGGIPGEVIGLSSLFLGFIVRENYLTGPLPLEVGKSDKLTVLDISENKLSGEIPSTLGNCLMLDSLEMEGVCVCAVIYRFRNSKQQPSSSSTEKNQYPQLSYAELHQSTNGFSSDNLIGKGRYGSVYKGILNSDEQTVAVKVLNLQESGAYKSFLAECEALGNLRHRNLVKVITSCSSVDFKGNDFKALVFEFMQNGSLESWLYPSSLEQNDTENLNLTQRLNMAIDVALALEYLHHHYDIPIAHCDLKLSNVLLDNNLSARVGDFGLAKFLATTGDSNYAQSSSIGIRGTVGYIAPEYGMGGDISTQGDLYSYGILLLELFTGKRPTNNMFRNNFNLQPP
ncbi:LOW QUALITY PROTEIN: probable LRR receptor-like serine/threonine-protein kinase At3g47570 [Camellia sinensis]|uniref:LOW QUALITY PROTEIN: probable LRR receptor-like serine/threonine-protein kinase At3g47570 n=1 Tax=Camellia sinensis TaxID=4442 RepID=UPI001036CECF|nr:LOW QUALITY PROTEIN: probable LRR receptor-like serine/threonine-protein kinase At3g47570 [Camellia sinensis]